MDNLPMDAAAASPVLLGRDGEIASIRMFLDSQPQPDVGALILSGDAGVGKSALLDVAAATAAPRYTVIRTAGAEAESDMGFAALSAVVHRVGTGAIAAVEPRFGQALEVALGMREAVAASYHLLAATGSIDTAHKFLLTALEMTPGEFSPADDTLLEAFYTWVRVCHFGNRATLWRDFDRQLARMPSPPAPLHLQTMLLRDPARNGAAATGALDSAIAELVTVSDPLHITRVAVAACYAERLPACRPALYRVVTAARHGGALPPAIDAIFFLAIDCFLSGRWDDTERLGTEALDWSQKTGITLLQSPGHWLRAVIAAAREVTTTTWKP